MRLNRLNQLVQAQRILHGRWRLTKRHELEYRRRGAVEQVVLSGDLVEVKDRGLTFRVREHVFEGERVGQRLTLRGRWQADSRNRLVFVAKRQRGRHDWLNLSGAWELDKRHELFYRFRQQSLKTQKRRIHTVRFRGFWDLAEDKRLTYVLERKSDSAFRFRGTFQTPSVLAKRGAIRYQVGIEAQGRRRLRKVTLFGKWKLSRDLSLTLEVPYRDGSVHGITFKTAFRVGARGRVEAQLLNRKGQPVGLTLVLTRPFLKGRGESFIRLRKNLEGSALEAGIRLPW